MYFFDCNTYFGNTTSMRVGAFSSVSDLVSNLKKYSVKKALVYHTLSKAYHPTFGNDALIREIENYPQLLPVWAVMPNHTNEFLSIAELEEKMRENHIKAVRMFPNEHNFSISEWCCGELIHFLEDKRIPLMIDMSSITCNDLYELCKSHTNLSIILIETGYSVDRKLYPLMKYFPNIYIQSGGYHACNGIENICTHFGAERIIFGSGLPSFALGSAISMIQYANITSEDKSKIAHGNLEKMLGGVLL